MATTPIPEAPTTDQPPALTRRRTRQTLQARARNALLAGIVLFVLSQAALRVAIEERRPELRDPNFENKFARLTRLLEERQPSPATILFMGSSVTVWGVKADLVEEPAAAVLDRRVAAFNLANNGSGPLTQLVYLQRLLRRGIKPDLVVLETSPMMYGDVENPCDTMLYPPRVLDRRDLDTIERHTRQADLHNNWWQAFLLPAYAHRIPILSQSATIFVRHDDRIDQWVGMDDHGWRRWEVPPPELHEKNLKRVQVELQARIGKFKLGKHNLAILHETTQLLAANRIPTIMVMMPEGPVFRSIYPPGSLGPFVGEMSALSRQHGMPFVQAREWMDEAKFIDSYHLTHVGATEFTERLVREGILPALSSDRASLAKGK
jgi:hypothetical protein